MSRAQLALCTTQLRHGEARVGCGFVVHRNLEVRGVERLGGATRFARDSRTPHGGDDFVIHFAANGVKGVLNLRGRRVVQHLQLVEVVDNLRHVIRDGLNPPARDCRVHRHLRLKLAGHDGGFNRLFTLDCHSLLGTGDG